MASLPSLPVDLFTEVVDYVNLPSDLKSLCLTSKHVRAVTVTVLYRNVIVHVDALPLRIPDDCRAHVRNIQFAVSDDDSPCHKYSSHMVTLVQSIPQDRLRSLSFYPPPLPLDQRPVLPEPVVHALWASQRRLDNLPLYPYHGFPAEAIAHSRLQDVTTLTLTLLEGNITQSIRAIIRYSAALRHLKIAASNMSHPSAQLDNLLNHLDDGSDALHLVALTLEYLHLGQDAAHRLARTIDLQGLASLVIYGCFGGPSELLMMMSVTPNGRLKKLDLRESRVRDLGGLLHNFTNLQQVSINLGPMELEKAKPVATCITHLSIIERPDDAVYFCNSAADRPLHPTMVERNAVVQNFRSLRQLNITIGTDPGEAWLHGWQFLNFCVQRTIGASLNLVALKLFVVASDNYIREEFFYDQEKTRLRRHARGIADKIFGAVHPDCPKFVALAIDLVQPDNVEPNINLFGFVRGKQLDLYGNATAVGLPMEVNMIKYLEPCSGVLGEY